jgi:hypothetical protein
MIVPIDRQDIPAYADRCSKRQDQLITATMNFVQYFIDLGDDKGTAEAKVTEVSTEVAAYLYAYVLGNKQPLIDGIDSSTLPFMDANAKSQLIQDLLS